MDPLDRSTIWPHEQGEPRNFYYQRFGSPTVAAAEAALGELDGGTALLFPSGAGATTALVLSLLEPGNTIALARGGYYGTGVALAALESWGLRVVEFDQTGPAARRRPARLARSAHQPVPHDAGSRGGCRPPGPGRRRCDRGHAGSPAATGARRRLRLAQRDEVPRGPRRRAARRGGLPRRHRCRGAADVPQQHRHRRRAGSCLAHASRPEDTRAARTAADRRPPASSPGGCGRIRRSRPSAIPASAGSSPSTWPMPRRRGRSRRRHA